MTEDRITKDWYKELRTYFNAMRKEIRQYPVGSQEYTDLYNELSDLSLELSSIRAKLKHRVLSIDSLNDLIGRIILGKSNEQSHTKNL